MSPAPRSSIYRHLLYGLLAVSAVVSGLLLFANRAVHEATLRLEEVVVQHVTPLAAAQRLQSRIDALRGLELELSHLRDFFAVTAQLDRMQGELAGIGNELERLHRVLAQDRPRETQRLDEHWQLYAEAVRREIELARAMDMLGVASISATRSLGAHDAISAILADLIENAEAASNSAYRHAQEQAERQESLFASVLAAGLLLLFAGLWLFGRSVSRRIAALRDAADSVAHGNQSEPIPVAGHDELAQLGRAFNTMQQRVREREAELTAAQARLQQRAVAAEAATLAKSQFLANMSHEIRTPMNGVLGMLEILRETPLNAEQADFAATAHESATALLDLLNDILDLSKIEAGKVQVNEIEFDLEQVVDDGVALLAERAFAKGLQLSTLIDATLPQRLRGDPSRLRQVLNNLLSNAVKFTEQGGIGLAVTPASGDAATPLLHFAVTDTGIGIAEADQARIFDAFTQADGSTTRRFGGTGLGLTISTQLVGAMGGRIGVESAPGRGSTFWFTLPLREAEVAEPPTALPGLAGSNVLVVDPQPQQRQYLVQRLQDWGCRVTAVAEAADAEASARAALAEARPFTLAVIADVLTDQVAVALPAALRALLPGLPTILVSPAGKACQEVAANVLGYDACLTRPLRRSQLQNCLLDLLGLPATAPDAPAASDTHALRVLVVEDNPVNQKVAVSMLRKLGCSSALAATGREALLQLEGERFDLVLMDCQMPEMDGIEATAAIRAREGPDQHVPIVAMTAHAMPADRERCLAVGMDDYLVKPISLDALRQVLARCRGTTREGPGEPTHSAAS